MSKQARLPVVVAPDLRERRGDRADVAIELGEEGIAFRIEARQRDESGLERPKMGLQLFHRYICFLVGHANPVVNGLRK